MRRVDAEGLARGLVERHLQPASCEGMAARLLGRRDPDPVACCEVAFARAAILRFVIADIQPLAIAERMNRALDAAVAGMFKGAHTPETAQRYGPLSLEEAAAGAVSRYQPEAFLGERLARMIAQSLGLEGEPPSDIGVELARITELAVVAMSRVRIR